VIILLSQVVVLEAQALMENTAAVAVEQVDTFHQ